MFSEEIFKEILEKIVKKFHQRWNENTGLEAYLHFYSYKKARKYGIFCTLCSPPTVEQNPFQKWHYGSERREKA